MTKRPAATMLAAVGALLLAVPGPGAAQTVDAQAVAEGARLYNTTCTRCHNARPATERSDAEWKIIVAHMRAMGNIPASRARAILAFMQATNGRDDAGSAAAPPLDAPESAVHAADFGLLLPEVTEYLARLRPSPEDSGQAGAAGEDTDPGPRR